ncbi:MAG: histone deacetylase family protein [Candidatus Bipolaricaulota bacterium]|nr:histone deacetylase family protein [Candidatus Bipolaricaulota bacterium]MBS3791050.1 histone deacetylase family protein [Candidatus Bipolaricaulota bacterium]
MDLVFSEEALQYRSAGHPESPDRVKKAHNYLKDKYDVKEPVQASNDDLLLVHDEDFVQRVKEGRFSDPDCPKYEDLFFYATLSAGGAITAQESGALSIMRPPGHHAGRNFLGGFCYFNNLAIAVEKSGLKTLIVDFDAHHGNGTEDIFLGKEGVTYLSLHRSPGFPGTGRESHQNAINHPVSATIGDEKYLDLLNEELQRLREKELEQLALSAGFDGHKDDPLASVGLSTSAFKEIGNMLREVGIPAFGVLEGGYVGDDLGRNIDAFLRGFNAQD